MSSREASRPLARDSAPRGVRYPTSLDEPDPSVEPDEGEPLGEDAPSPLLAAVRAKHPSSGRSRTIPAKRPLSKQEKRRADKDYYPDWASRPETRADCKGQSRPCPWVSCEAHLYLDVDEDTGALKLNFPDLEVWQMPFTCSIDEAESTQGDGMTLEQVAERTNLTRERIRQLEERVKAEARAGRFRRLRVID